MAALSSSYAFVPSAFKSVVGYSESRLKHLVTPVPAFPVPATTERVAGMKPVVVQQNPPSSLRSPYCRLCGVLFQDNLSAMDHGKSHLNIIISMCYLCGEQFGDTASVQSHILADHKNIDTFICFFCRSAFSHHKDLDDHLRLMHCQFEWIIVNPHASGSHTNDCSHIAAESPTRTSLSSKSPKDFGNVPVSSNGNEDVDSVFLDSPPLLSETHCADVSREHILVSPSQSETSAMAQKYKYATSGKKRQYYASADYDNCYRLVQDSKKTKYECVQCTERFPTRNGVLRHQVVHKEEHYICPVCGKILSRPEYLRNHMTIHQQEAKYQCCVCLRVFHHPGTYDQHMRKHVQDDRLSPKVFSSDATIDDIERARNMLKELGKTIGPVKHRRKSEPAVGEAAHGFADLPTMAEVFSPESNHHSNDDSRLPSHDNDIMKSQSTMNDSKLSVHSSFEEKVGNSKLRQAPGCNTYRCGICRKLFLRLGCLYRHLETHGVISICSKCNATFTGRQGIKQHIKTSCRRSQIRFSYRGRIVDNNSMIIKYDPMNLPFTHKKKLLQGHDRSNLKFRRRGRPRIRPENQHNQLKHKSHSISCPADPCREDTISVQNELGPCSTVPTTVEIKENFLRSSSSETDVDVESFNIDLHGRSLNSLKNTSYSINERQMESDYRANRVFPATYVSGPQNSYGGNSILELQSTFEKNKAFPSCTLQQPSLNRSVTHEFPCQRSISRIFKPETVPPEWFLQAHCGTSHNSFGMPKLYPASSSYPVTSCGLPFSQAWPSPDILLSNGERISGCSPRNVAHNSSCAPPPSSHTMSGSFMSAEPYSHMFGFPHFCEQQQLRSDVHYSDPAIPTLPRQRCAQFLQNNIPRSSFQHSVPFLNMRPSLSTNDTHDLSARYPPQAFARIRGFHSNSPRLHEQTNIDIVGQINMRTSIFHNDH